MRNGLDLHPAIPSRVVAELRSEEDDEALHPTTPSRDVLGPGERLHELACGVEPSLEAGVLVSELGAFDAPGRQVRGTAQRGAARRKARDDLHDG